MSAEVFCIHCGRKNLAEARFCQFCGEPIPQIDEGPVETKSNEVLECPYCGQQMSVEKNISQLLCIQCAAAFEVKRVNGKPELNILRF